MRGLNFRQKSDIRRHWRCPECGVERKAPASVTVLRCGCAKSQPFMKLVEPQRVVRPALQTVNKYVTDEDLDALYGPELPEPLPPEILDEGATLVEIREDEADSPAEDAADEWSEGPDSDDSAMPPT